MMKSFSGALVLVLSFCLPATAGEINKDEAFKLGQSMIECGAFFTAMDKSGIVKDKPATTKLMQDKARGWRMAGLMWLTEGLAEAKQTQALEIASNIETTQTTFYLSMYEQGEAGLKMMQEDFQKNCIPLVDIQMKTVAVTRKQ